MIDFAYDLGWHLLRGLVFVAIMIERFLDVVFFVGYPAWRWSQFVALCIAFFLISLAKGIVLADIEAQSHKTEGNAS